PFDMEMLDGYTAMIDPATQTVTDLTADNSCPLSALGAGQASICFHDNGSGGVDQLRVTAAGRLTSQYTMSGTVVAGDAMFSADAASIAYETVPTADSGCGPQPYPTTPHALN